MCPCYATSWRSNILEHSPTIFTLFGRNFWLPEWPRVQSVASRQSQCSFLTVGFCAHGNGKYLNFKWFPLFNSRCQSLLCSLPALQLILAWYLPTVAPMPALSWNFWWIRNGIAINSPKWIEIGRLLMEQQLVRENFSSGFLKFSRLCFWLRRNEASTVGCIGGNIFQSKFHSCSDNCKGGYGWTWKF